MVNREIKFRAWDKFSKEMIYSGIEYKKRTLSNPKYGKNNEWGSDTIGFMNNNYEHFNLMQFTGLKDKNGKEIYENDVISDGNTKFRVYSVAGGFAIKAPYWASCMEDFKFGDELIIQPLADAQTMSYIKESCTVIGNIHENPELLNK